MKKIVLLAGLLLLSLRFPLGLDACHDDMFQAEAMWFYEEAFGVLAFVKAEDENSEAIVTLYNGLLAKYGGRTGLVFRMFDVDKVKGYDQSIVEKYNKDKKVMIRVVTPNDNVIAEFNGKESIAEASKVFSSGKKKEMMKIMEDADVLFLYTSMKAHKAECREIEKHLKTTIRQADDLYGLVVKTLAFDPNDEQEKYLVKNLGLKEPYKPTVYAIIGMGKMINTIESPVDLEDLQDTLQLIFSPLDQATPSSNFGDRILIAE